MYSRHFNDQCYQTPASLLGEKSITWGSYFYQVLVIPVIWNNPYPGIHLIDMIFPLFFVMLIAFDVNDILFVSCLVDHIWCQLSITTGYSMKQNGQKTPVKTTEFSWYFVKYGNILKIIQNPPPYWTYWKKELSLRGVFVECVCLLLDYRFCFSPLTSIMGPPLTNRNHWWLTPILVQWVYGSTIDQKKPLLIQWDKHAMHQVRSGVISRYQQVLIVIFQIPIANNMTFTVEIFLFWNATLISYFGMIFEMSIKKL